MRWYIDMRVMTKDDISATELVSDGIGWCYKDKEIWSKNWIKCGIEYRRRTILNRRVVVWENTMRQSKGHKGLVHMYNLCNLMVYPWIGQFLFGRILLNCHLWHGGRARAPAAGFEKGIDRDFEPWTPEEVRQKGKEGLYVAQPYRHKTTNSELSLNYLCIVQDLRKISGDLEGVSRTRLRRISDLLCAMVVIRTRIPGPIKVKDGFFRSCFDITFEIFEDFFTKDLTKF
ncbi:hypothetical protein RND71_040341 [Anisodus tanguticus]|uniref:Uncharacterized protein n=1 Tax=Anisodus tanguticus TaxID=243964 RepID=A0AAE1QRZ6_9SOLA|nr:hypothetical protein RND71_040341 [Anisodus tanguticus]